MQLLLIYREINYTLSQNKSPPYLLTTENIEQILIVLK